MKGGNEFSKNVMSFEAEAWIVKLHKSLVLKDYGKGTIKSYTAEMTLLFKYHWQKPVEEIRQADVEQYLLYIKDVHKVGRAKCEQLKK